MLRLIFIASSLLLLLYCCSNNTKKRAEEPITLHPSPNPVYQRDSFYIAHTVMEFMKKGVDIFDFHNQFNIPLDKVVIHVDSIFYSPDSLKLFAFVIIKDYESNSKIPDAYYYTGEGFVGFREKAKQPWSIWLFNQYTPAGFKSYDKVRSYLRKYYLGSGRFKFDYATYWDGIHNDTLGMARRLTVPNQDNRVNIKFGYNLDDPLFWDSSIVWKKGSRIPGYYAFQTIGNVAPGFVDSPIKKMPILDYPDSLLKLYK